MRWKVACLTLCLFAPAVAANSITVFCKEKYGDSWLLYKDCVKEQTQANGAANKELINLDNIKPKTTNFSHLVPDDIISQETDVSIDKFADTSGLTCHDYDVGSDSFNECVSGRKQVFLEKSTYPAIYETCYEAHDGTQLVASCLVSWVDKSVWISSDKLEPAVNLLLRGCIQNHGFDFDAVNLCFSQ
jgi:hypothetical protein